MSDKVALGLKIWASFVLMIIVGIFLFLGISLFLNFQKANATPPGAEPTGGARLSHSNTPSPATHKFDGAWTLSIYKDCDKTTSVVIIEIRDAKVSSTQTVLDILGRIGDNGRVDIIISHDGKVFYTKGNFTPFVGNGEWQSEAANCRGTWKAVRK